MYKRNVQLLIDGAIDGNQAIEVQRTASHLQVEEATNGVSKDFSDQPTLQMP